MPNRRTWTSEEDNHLKEIMKSEDLIQPMWGIVKYKMEQKGFIKTTRQCRERWVFHLDPTVLKGSWNKKENIKLFEVHKKHGNQWKLIATEFEHRTAHSIKNHFFSLIRKSLRIAFKIVGRVGSSRKVKSIKPAVITESMNKTIDIKMKNNIIHKVSLNEFLQRFIFGKNSKCKNFDHDNFYIIGKCLDFLQQRNQNYSKNKKIIQSKKKIKKRSKKIISKNKTSNSIRINSMKLIKGTKNIKKDVINSSGYHNSVQNLDYSNNSKKRKVNLIETSKEIEDLVKNENRLKKKFKEPIDLRRELILLFDKIKFLSKTNIKIIKNSKEEDLIKYAKDVQINSQQNIFDITKKNNQFFGMGSEFFCPTEKNTKKIDIAKIFIKNNYRKTNTMDKIDRIFNKDKLKIATNFNFRLNNSIFVTQNSNVNEIVNNMSDLSNNLE